MIRAAGGRAGALRPLRQDLGPVGGLDVAGLTVALAAVPERRAGQAGGEIDGEADAGDEDARAVRLAANSCASAGSSQASAASMPAATRGTRGMSYQKCGFTSGPDMPSTA